MTVILLCISLFSTQAVFHMPTVDSDEPRKNMPLALQSLFFKVRPFNVDLFLFLSGSLPHIKNMCLVNAFPPRSSNSARSAFPPKT